MGIPDFESSAFGHSANFPKNYGWKLFLLIKTELSPALCEIPVNNLFERSVNNHFETSVNLFEGSVNLNERSVHSFEGEVTPFEGEANPF